MSVPLLDLSLQHAPLMDRFRAAFDRIATTGRFILGPDVDQFEADLAAYCGVPHALGVSSGTDALLLAMMAVGVGPGDEVIVPPFTFFCTAGCVSRLGARPVFVDIDPVTFNMRPELIEKAITRQTKAIMPVHLFGQAAEMGPIMQVARKHGLKVIEDAAQALGTKDQGRPSGTLGDIACFSFYPTKNLAAFGDAGAVVTQDPALHETMKKLRVHGQADRYHHELVGGNFRLDAIQAAILSIKLPLLDGWASARRRHATRYGQLLAGLPIKLPIEAPGKFHVFNQFTIRVEAERREALRDQLRADGIGHEVYYPVPLHLQKCYDDLGNRPGEFPESERAAREVLSLPVFPELTETQQDEVANAVRKFFGAPLLD